MDEQFVREEMAIGSAAMERLRRSHVAVFGLGGVGSYTAEALARAGVGRLTLIDEDTVSLSNLNRQLCALHSTLGQSKAAVMAQRVRDINPHCRVQARCSRYTEAEKEQFFAEPYDYIADAIDTVSCKLSLIETAKARKIPIISAMGTGNKLDPTAFCVTDLAKTAGCPLARVMRRELKARGIVHHKVVYSREEALTPAPLASPPPGRRSVPASVSWVPSVAGLILAGAIIQDLIAIQHEEERKMNYMEIGKDDYDAFHELANAYFREGEDKDTPQDIIDGFIRSLFEKVTNHTIEGCFAKDAGASIGFALWTIDTEDFEFCEMPGLGTILEIGLIPSCRASGLGKEFARYIEENMRKKEVRQCYVSAYGPAQKFWAHCGYVENGRKASNGLPIMVKDIVNSQSADETC